MRETPLVRNRKPRALPRVDPGALPRVNPEEMTETFPTTGTNENHPLRSDELIQKVIHEYERINPELNNLALSLETRCVELQDKVKTYHTRLANLKMEFERQQARKMSKFWFLTIFALVLLKYHSYAHRNMFGLVLCETAFIYNFRLLYLANSPYATFFGWLAIFITVFFV